MGKKYLIDTNTLLEYVAEYLPVKAHIFVNSVVQDSFNISVINRIEVLGHASANQDLSDFIDLANTYQLSEAIVNRTISIRKQKKIKLPDAIIAATALTHDLTIVSRNITL
jgi:toxin FitB